MLCCCKLAFSLGRSPHNNAQRRACGCPSQAKANVAIAVCCSGVNCLL